MKKSPVWNLTTTSVSGIVFYAVCGILLLILPTQAIAIANYAIAAILAVAGVICIINYFHGSVLDGLTGVRLALGLVLICFAVLMFCYPTFLAELLPSIWGLSLLVGGFGKIQMAADMKRIGEKHWWLLLLGAVLSFVLGVMCMANPLFITAFITQFIGISLLVEAVLDLIAFIAITSKVKKFRKSMEEAANSVEV